jgi:glycosyltransferase involved in cell wall biosynthesis
MAGAEVNECHATLWHGIEDRVQAASGGWRSPRFWLRVLRTYIELLRQYRCAGDYDVMLVGYPGQIDTYLARLLTWRRRKPLALDIYMSIALVAQERGLGARSPFTLRLLRAVEWGALRLPDRLISDTRDYVEWLGRQYGVAPERFRLVPIGAEDDAFPPLPPKARGPVFRVNYAGTYIPNHSVATIVAAARLLQAEPDIRFEMIGDGPDRPEAQALAQGLPNIEFVQWLETDALAARYAAADVLLGSFGRTPQSLMTVHNKVYQGLALGRPVITGDSPAIRRLFTLDEEILVCARQDPQALADTIRRLRDHPELGERLSRQGQARFAAEFDLAHNGQRLLAHLRELVPAATAAR